MGMIELAKQAALDAIKASSPVNVTFGEVLSIDNLKIKVDQKLILDKSFFIIPKSLTKYEVDLTHNHGYSNALGKLIIREGLKQGDKVLLLRVQGGQQYVIWDKVV
ncbi:DUF2577 domain-containing protein [Clostridium botulinum]|uniref:DUF2577 domain-containing protein n=1 Tax=Clostridium botulinum TaxID=1491 RepID=UPI0006A42E77|nr:DUF2577 domain-containing protein [Clostridium botulinum]KOC49996.1 hypothetical protein ADU88_04180 [Clostridium botulinum]